jgi:hypothetical protein
MNHDVPRRVGYGLHGCEVREISIMVEERMMKEKKFLQVQGKKERGLCGGGEEINLVQAPSLSSLKSPPKITNSKISFLSIHALENPNV